MLQHIPTHLIAGPLGAGKTSLIRQLLAQRPVGERWAVLINEFGQIGLDAALLSTDDQGVAMGEVAGGCLCCVNGAPFQVGLGRLLRKARPDRLFIEPSGLGHPAQLLAQLAQAPWQGVLSVQPAVLVLDAQALAAGIPLPAAQAQALSHAGLLVLNKADPVDSEKRLWISKQFPDVPLFWTEQGYLPLDRLPGNGQGPVEKSIVDKLVLPNSAAPSLALWTDPSRPLCVHQQLADAWSIGWQWHPAQPLDRARLQAFLEGLEWRRAKMVIHSAKGWFSANAVEGQGLEWRSSEWRKDSRIELIFAQAQEVAVLEAGMLGCRV
ncbi:CobW family GTP-binding protein [Pseudomonas fontis]|uniref:GTP-binding protein n=1 Tax=Pseudomonas fontis TaxID=2942633 RepID=A0ABT5NKR1_9PSED|nr:GTP-binding protein [Pseudomonas fontis]MDD0975966.1 GTP-binding protein [Pseudomonas fontis]MDD0989119.1 GTP-binding protein [Pseudomonas fontis]